MHVAKLQITWLGHGTFIITSPGGVRILIDPWLTDNPACPEAFKRVDDIDLIVVTHGHSDHVGDLVRVARATGVPVIGIVELCNWLKAQGLRAVRPMNKGGTQRFEEIDVTMVSADHSSGLVVDGRLVYLGEPAGYVFRFEDGLVVYFAGDTGLFGDMRLIGEVYAPVVGFLPIGDRFTMGPDTAARAWRNARDSPSRPDALWNVPSLDRHSGAVPCARRASERRSVAASSWRDDPVNVADRQGLSSTSSSWPSLGGTRPASHANRYSGHYDRTRYCKPARAGKDSTSGGAGIETTYS